MSSPHEDLPAFEFFLHLDAWIRCCIEARLIVAKAASPAIWKVRQDGKDSAALMNEHVVTPFAVFSGNSAIYNANHACHSQPENVIAACQSDLAILDHHYILREDDRNEAYEEFSVVPRGGYTKDFGCVTCDYLGMGGVKGGGYCLTIKYLGWRFRHYPGYREEWQPPAESFR